MCSPLGTGCFSVDNLTANLLQCRLLSSCQEPAASQASHGGHSFLWASTCSDTFHRLSVCFKVNLHGLQSQSCLSMLFTTGCRGISAPTPGAAPPPPSLQALVSAELSLSHILTSFSSSHCCCSFFPLLNLLLQRNMAITHGLKLGQRQIHPGPGWHLLL